MTNNLSQSFTINADGWLEPARHQLSPNHNERPVNTTVDLLVIHNISLPPEQFNGDYVEQFFLNRLDPAVHPYFETIKELTVSSHLLIRRDGQVIQFVPFHLRAWHAGTSSFCGQENCNDFSIGIELEGSDTQAFTAAQYQTLAGVTQVIRQYFPAITLDRIVGHSDIAPGRKTDPGPFFDWQLFKAQIEKEGNNAGRNGH